MEHLTYRPLPRSYRCEIRAAFDGPLEVSDWGEYEKIHGAHPPTDPRVPWLGHDHEVSSYYHRPEYEAIPMLHAFQECYGVGWDIDKMLRHGDVRVAHGSLKKLAVSEAVKRTAAFIQAWLYLGLLESILALPIAISYLVRTDDDGSAYIYSRTLPILLDVQSRRFRTMEPDYQQAGFQLARECATNASSILCHIIEEISKLDRKQPFKELKAMLLTTEPALSSLHEAIIRFCELRLMSTIWTSINPYGLLPKSYSENLIRKGWCPFVISSAESAMSASMLRYIDIAGFTKTTTGHEQCTPEQCGRNNIQISTYTQQHWPSKCRCHFLKPDHATVLDILDHGYIPLVRLAEDMNSLEISAAPPDQTLVDYIAISHVWADGLGSTTEVGLPACQVRRLHELSKQKTHEAWFWIDALCVPKFEPYRGKAIQLMKLTYKNAVGVIVIDKGLKLLSVKDPALEIGWSIIASGWYGRLWTYQEGFLPPWVYLDLKDGLANLYSVIQDLYKDHRKIETNPLPSSNPFPSVFIDGLLGLLQKARPVDRWNHERPWSRRLVDTFNALTRRRSSRPDDQILVIGLLLDVPIDHLLELEGEEKWRAFYYSLQKIPWTIVFDRRPKMQTSPFTWAPSTWISFGKDEWLDYDDDMAEITRKGLKVTIEVLVLDKEVSVSSQSLLIETTDDTIYNLWRLEGIARAESRIQSFNLIFVRHVKHEHPAAHLNNNTSICFRVGLGLKTGSSVLRHDFGQEWEIEQPHILNVKKKRGTIRQRASWKKLVAYFT
ncbi:hypothetical protein TWF694_007303 [Orbilia ellipsospora]|uniref:Heterokaryon incompatibility domain-containing protein n=1 Tax=Orbilia ellipsospora TaxID=2528407 RepID=A0AAV9XHA2_9PEZI